MRNLSICVLFATFSLVTHAQSTSDILKQQAAQGVKEGAKEGTTVATEKAADKLSDKIMSKIFDKKKKANPDNTATNTKSGGSASGSATTDNNSKQENKDAPASFKTYSKFDFIPGDKILAYDDFSKYDRGFSCSMDTISG